MIQWKTDKPSGDLIVAKLTDQFCGGYGRYALLYFVTTPYPHYEEDFEEVPETAIEKWERIN